MLTEKRIRDAKPEENEKTGKPKLTFIWDKEVVGLGLRITPKGAKSFVLRYRVAGKERLATLGKAGWMSLREARERAGRELAAIRAGETDPLRRRQDAIAAPTVADGLDRFFGEWVPRRQADGRLSERTAYDYRKQAERTVRPALGKLKVAEVTRHDVERAIAPRGPVQRNRTLAFVSRLFNLFEEWEWRAVHSNPCRHIEKAREEARDRVLAPAELSALGHALDGEREASPAATAAVAVAVLTGLRIGEVIAMQWEHVDMETGRVLLPETKTGRRWHDLPDAALAVLDRLPRLNAYCFTTGRDAPITYKTAHGAFSRAAKVAGLSDVRPHDLRRTFVTNAAAAGLSVLQLQHLLGWKQAAMPARYVNLAGEATREARRALGQATAAMLEGNC